MLPLKAEPRHYIFMSSVRLTFKSFISDNTVHKKNKREDTERQTVVQINT